MIGSNLESNIPSKRNKKLNVANFFEINVKCYVLIIYGREKVLLNNDTKVLTKIFSTYLRSDSRRKESKNTSVNLDETTVYSIAVK